MFFIPAVLLIVLDQAIKFLIESKITLFERVPVIDGFFYITHTTNKGAAWGILQNMNIVFIPLTLIVAVVLSYLLIKNKDKLFRFAGVLILAGAIGNFVDRVFRESGVVDYLEFHFGEYIFPIFNLADSLVVCGSILLGIYVLFFYDKKERK